MKSSKYKILEFDKDRNVLLKEKKELGQIRRFINLKSISKLEWLLLKIIIIDSKTRKESVIKRMFLEVGRTKEEYGLVLMSLFTLGFIIKNDDVLTVPTAIAKVLQKHVIWKGE